MVKFFNFNDNNPGYITPLGLLQSRLYSLGYKEAHELADFLPEYYSYFEAFNKANEEKLEKERVLKENIRNMTTRFRINEPVLSNSSTNAKLLSYLDEIMHTNKNFITFITVTQIYEGLDDRLIMISFNNLLLNLLISDQNFNNRVFEKEYIEYCLQLLYCCNYESRMKEMMSLLKIIALKNNANNEKNTYFRDINTIYGDGEVELKLNFTSIAIDGCQFMIYTSIIPDNEKNSWIINTMKEKKSFLLENEKKKTIENLKISMKNTDWEKLLKFYFPKIMKNESSIKKNCKKHSHSG